jgi:drug/metabolite transporter (DMT)-like permease
MSARAWTAFAAVSTLWGMLVALLALRFDPSERATGRRALGLAIGFAGVVALVGLDVSGNSDELIGALAILLAAVAHAVDTLGVAVLDERPGAGAVAGLLLILAGSWLSTDGRLPPGLNRVQERARGGANPVVPDAGT